MAGRQRKAAACGYERRILAQNELCSASGEASVALFKVHVLGMLGQTSKFLVGDGIKACLRMRGFR